MRVMLVAETFLPAVNGVVNSVLHVAGELADRGHQPVVVAPSGSTIVSPAGHRIDVIRVPSMSLPGYPGLRVGRPGLDLRPLVRDLDPDILHLASPAICPSRWSPPFRPISPHTCGVTASALGQLCCGGPSGGCTIALI
jgi:phosphatidylinositol alpha 1,6-mannosyltransferase